MNLDAAEFAWVTVLLLPGCVFVCCWAAWRVARAIRNAFRWIRTVDQQLATEAWIRAAELQADDDLAAIQAIAALDTHDPRRTR